jgi:hypothetical protein
LHIDGSGAGDIFRGFGLDAEHERVTVGL